MILGDIVKEGLGATLGSRFAIPELMKRIAQRIGKEHLEGEEAFTLLREGNQMVKAEMQAYHQALAYQLFNFQCAYDPDIFLIGGGISQQPEFISMMQDAVDQLLSRIPFSLPRIQVAPTAHQADANLIGAVYEFLYRHHKR